MKILLDRFKSKSSNDKRKGVTISFKNGKKLLSELNMTEDLSEFETYRKERLASTKYRLVFEVNPVCSNVLFNTATEIVKDEGSDSATWLTNEATIIDGVVGKSPTTKWDGVTGVMDTQISKPDIGYEYHCGYDIFDNHLLRGTGFRVVNYATNLLDEFNTIADVQRDYSGTEVHRYPDDREEDETPAGPLLPNHLYDRENLLSFDDAIDANLVERNGWFGFTNPTTMKAYDRYGKDMGINRLINSKGTCDFIDMYPGRDLYSFVPKYNKNRARFEKNWNYCLTYPSSSTTSGIEFIEKDLESLKAAYFNEQIIGRDGRRTTTIYSVTKHGLGAGDTVNVYKSYQSGATTIHEMCLSGVTVSTVVDDYTFTVYAGTQRISDQWIDVFNNVDEYVYYPHNSDTPSTLKFNAKRNRLYDEENPEISFPIIDMRCCVDTTTMKLSFKRVEAGFECKYYVRIFSRLPNFKFAKMEVTERNLYNPLSDTHLIEDNQMVPFQDNLSKLAFASNSYSDTNAELVFLDDVDVNGLRDNLGRPLTEIYLTCVKNNAGYKEWYGKYDWKNNKTRPIDLSANTVEYSHAFGKVNCGYILSEASREDNQYCNVLFMTNVGRVDNGRNLSGMNVTYINPESDRDSNDEINFNEDGHFYGDLCEFCVGSYTERSLQEVYHRFNTAQRELTTEDTAFQLITDQCKYHEIISDDFDSDGFVIREFSLSESIASAEGYIYKPHNRIELRTFRDELEVGYPRICTPRSINKISTGGTYQIRTVEDNYFEIGNKFLLYNVVDNDYYNCIISSVDNPKTVSFKVYDRNWNEVEPNLADISIYRTASPDSSIPPYAFMSTDGSMRYFWHTVMANGFNTNIEEEEYPFANGAFYINKKVNIYVKRQDPYGFNGLWRTTRLGNIDGSHSNIVTVDNYVTEGDTEC